MSRKWSGSGPATSLIGQAHIICLSDENVLYRLCRRFENSFSVSLACSTRSSINFQIFRSRTAFIRSFLRSSRTIFPGNVSEKSPSPRACFRGSTLHCEQGHPAPAKALLSAKLGPHQGQWLRRNLQSMQLTENGDDIIRT